MRKSTLKGTQSLRNKGTRHKLSYLAVGRRLPVGELKKHRKMKWGTADRTKYERGEVRNGWCSSLQGFREEEGVRIEDVCVFGWRRRKW